MDKTTLNDLTATRMKYVRQRISKNIRAAMQKQELSQQELAMRSGLNASTLSDILNLKVPSPKIETIVKIESGLGMNIFSVLNDPKEFEI